MASLITLHFTQPPTVPYSRPRQAVTRTCSSVNSPSLSVVSHRCILMDEQRLGSSGLQTAVRVSKVFLSREVAPRAELCDFHLNLSVSDRQAPPSISMGVISKVRAKRGKGRLREFSKEASFFSFFFFCTDNLLMRPTKTFPKRCMPYSKEKQKKKQKGEKK